MGLREEQPTSDDSGAKANERPDERSDEFSQAYAQAYELLSRRVAQARAAEQSTAGREGYALADLEFRHLHQVYDNLSVPELVEHALMQGEGGLSSAGALCVKTAPYAARSPANTLIVDFGHCPTVRPETSASDRFASHLSRDLSRDQGAQPMALSEEAFRHLHQEAQAYVQGRSLYIVDGAFAASLPIRVVTELASQALFVKQLLYPRPQHSQHLTASLGPTLETLSGISALPITLVVLPGLKGEPSLEPELQCEVFSALYPTHRLGILGGSRCGQEIEAAILHLVEPILLEQQNLPLNQAQLFSPPLLSPPWSQSFAAAFASTFASAVTGSNAGQKNCSILLLGDSMSQKLLQPVKVWSTGAILNGFAGAYRPIVEPTAEPQLQHFAAQYGFGCLLENVVLDAQTGSPDLGDRRWSATPWAIQPSASPEVLSQDLSSLHALVLSLWDPEGIFPPVMQLSLEQIQFYYLCGYGNWSEPDNWEGSGKGTFRACFSKEISVEQAIARVLQLGEQLKSLPASIPYLLVNTASGDTPRNRPLPILQASTWYQKLKASPDQRIIAQPLFQRFHDYAHQFLAAVEPSQAEALDRICAAGPLNFGST